MGIFKNSRKKSNSGENELRILVEYGAAVIFFSHPKWNIVNGALYTRSKNTYSEGQNIKLEFTFPDKHTVIRCQGEVVAVEEVAMEGSVGIGAGIKLRGISEEERDLLEHYAGELWNLRQGHTQGGRRLVEVVDDISGEHRIIEDRRAGEDRRSDERNSSFNDRRLSKRIVNSFWGPPAQAKGSPKD